MNTQFFAGKKILITGGIGFIGSHLARRLVDTASEITIVDSLIPKYGGNIFNINDIQKKININISDVRDPHSIAHLVKGQHYLFNLAGQTSHLDSMQDPRTDLDINASAQLSILEACRNNNKDIKIIFASTRQLYGKPKFLPVNENHPISPVDVNGINKLAGEWYHLLYNNAYGLRACALRLTNTSGPGMRVKDARQTFLGIWIRNIIEGKSFSVFGDGEQLRDFNYVDDVVDAMLLSALDENTNGEVFNLGSSEVISLKDLADKLVEIHQSGSYEIHPFPQDRKAIDIGDYYSDYSKINTLLGWKPCVTLKNGLRHTLDYYLANFKHYWE